MEDDWGLQAVVRGCSTSSSSAVTTTSCSSMDVLSSFSSFQQQQDERLLCFPDLFEQRTGNFFEEELHDLCKPFFPRSRNPDLSPPTFPMSPLSVLGAFQEQSQPQQQLVLEQQKQIQVKQQSFSGSRSPMVGPGHGATHAPTPRSKRRKNQMKRVCQVPAEDLSSDMWSWRKYGQKPIKGSPYPRGYYRCSTSKGCLARKQVERNRSDPSMFIVTYTSDHNHPMPTHRNSLAGSTRQKPATSQTSGSSDKKPTCSPPTSPAGSLSPATDKTENRNEGEDLLEVEDEDDEMLGVSDTGVSEDFFEGLEELVCPQPQEAGSGDRFVADQVTGGLTFQWLGNSATTTAADGG